MILKDIKIFNYKSIKEEIFPINEINKSYAYSLIGVNESGKSTILKAIFLKTGQELPIHPRDYNEPSKPIEIVFDYQISAKEIIRLKEILIEKGLDERDAKKINSLNLKGCYLRIVFESISPTFAQKSAELKMDDLILKNYTLENGILIKSINEVNGDNIKEDEEKMINIKNYIETEMVNIMFGFSHEIVFWKAESKYLITDPINLASFSVDPVNISIPLKNCFELSGIENIKQRIDMINNNPAEAVNLKDLLSDKVTEHIKRVWPEHPIRIKFDINGKMLSFLIEDDGVKYKTKVTSQRSDGFKQFISFLLTVSAQNSNNKLSNTLLLLDEPETHLHPQGQENLRDELIDISTNNLNNIVIFATHSNYMIDKNNLNRCFKISKEENLLTKIEQLKNKNISYSEVNYIVFDIPTNDYHNELYGYLEENKKTKLDQIKKSRKWINKKSSETWDVSLAAYIRHSIHHPENSLNKHFTKKELIESIENLRKLKYEI